MISVTRQNDKKLYDLIFFFFFGDGDTSSYKTNVVKFVILVTLINKKSDINSEKKKTKKNKNKTLVKWVKTCIKILATLKL